MKDAKQLEGLGVETGRGRSSELRMVESTRDGETSSAGYWRVERARLTEQRAKEVRRRKRVYGSFALSSSIVQRLGCATEADYRAWYEIGEGHSPYVPKPDLVEKYYTERGEWLGWRSWLTGDPVAD